MKNAGGLLVLFVLTLGLTGLFGLGTLSVDAGEKLPQADLVLGEQIYKKACFACHETGLLGAPKLGSTEEWKPKIDKGMETLFQNAINGFQGATGYMPPRGGMDLSDEEVFSALVYMVEKSR